MTTLLSRAYLTRDAPARQASVARRIGVIIPGLTMEVVQLS